MLEAGDAYTSHTACVMPFFIQESLPVREFLISMFTVVACKENGVALQDAQWVETASKESILSSYF